MNQQSLVIESLGDTVMARQYVYGPIQPYQTRIIRLFCSNGHAASPLQCSLHTADILHSTFEGFGLHFPSGRMSLTQFEALSYAWGSEDMAETITCDGYPLKIGMNLYEALRALRQPSADRYLWADAICIDQVNKEEVGTQVSNMFVIYKKAARVIAWLGASNEDVEYTLAIIKSLNMKSPPNAAFDFWRVFKGIEYLYSKPWFERLWIQQEVFAARDLHFQCGALQFQWSEWLSSPDLLLGLPEHQGKVRATHAMSRYPNLPISTEPMSLNSDQLDAFEYVKNQHKARLTCFENFSKRSDHPTLLETLLHTARMQAKDPRDYVYGILGIAGFPAKPMVLSDWKAAIARHNEAFIPIDYSGDLASILTIVTFVLLMKGSLKIIAKFKCFGTDAGHQHLPLPSWVVDWRLAARNFAPRSKKEGPFPLIDSSDFASFKPEEQPLAKQFLDDNRDFTLSQAKLVVRGIVDSRYYPKGTEIWHIETGEDTVAWYLEINSKPGDIVVYLANFDGSKASAVPDIGAPRYNDALSDGLWLLRPVKNGIKDEFEFLAFLSRLSHESMEPPYHRWEHVTPYEKEMHSVENEYNRYRRLRIGAHNGPGVVRRQVGPWAPHFSPPTEQRNLIGARRFTIV